MTPSTNSLSKSKYEERWDTKWFPWMKDNPWKPVPEFSEEKYLKQYMDTKAKEFRISEGVE